MKLLRLATSFDTILVVQVQNNSSKTGPEVKELSAVTQMCRSPINLSFLINCVGAAVFLSCSTFNLLTV